MKSDAAIPRNLTFRSARAWSLSMKRTRRTSCPARCFRRFPPLRAWRSAVPISARSANVSLITGFAFAEAQGRLVVPAEQASGVAVLFEE